LKWSQQIITVSGQWHRLTGHDKVMYSSTTMELHRQPIGNS